MAERNPTLERLALSVTEAGAMTVVRIIFKLSTDAELLAAYAATDRRPGNPIADILGAELQRRDLAD